MKIAIIGAGNVGKALGGSLTRAGHDVTLTSRGDSAAQAAASTGASAAHSMTDAVASSDVTIIAVPFAQSGEQVAREIALAASGKVVIDATNPVDPSYESLVTEQGPSAAELFQQWMPQARVAKAFNTTFASVQADASVAGQTVDGFVAADDDQARATALQLVEEIGLRPVDVGPLRRARELEALAFLNIKLNASNGWAWNTAFKLANAPIAEPRSPVGAGSHKA